MLRALVSSSAQRGRLLRPLTANKTPGCPSWCHRPSPLQICHFGAHRELSSSSDTGGFKKILAANRGEIATRIMRAGTELNLETCGIYSAEDRFTQHRYKADQAFELSSSKSPVGAYLDIDSIVQICLKNKIDCVHPGYGFLSENVNFARALEANGITFVGPTAENLATFGDKTSARELAVRAGVPVVEGTEDAVSTVEEARDAIENGVPGVHGPIGYPVIIKAAMGGGGRGMRVCLTKEELEANFSLASNEALTAFGDGRCFIEHYVDRPRHIEVQGIGDGTGNVVHLYDRDCSVQRRHQKCLETAPAMHLPEKTRQALFDDSLKLLKEAKYKNAGTVEFLVDQQGNHFFIEVNPRVQVEHTVTEEVTGIDIVQTQIKIAAGKTLEELGLRQESISTSGYAMQCRVTTEDPSEDFRPDTGRIETFRLPGGMGIRLDDGPGFPGASITPHYDSLLVKITAKARERREATKKLIRAIKEFRVRGVKTNKSFLLNVLHNDDFVNGAVDTSFIASNPGLVEKDVSRDRGGKILKFIAESTVNGPPPSLGATGPLSLASAVAPEPPKFGPRPLSTKKSLRDIYVNDGAQAFAKAVRERPGLLLMDTTWRDAHQSLLATRLRTKDIIPIAKPTAAALGDSLYSMECWGGATFDVSMRFLKECPWDRLALMREKVPDVPFQMLLRGANAVGYTSYPDNAVFEFCRLAQGHGMDVFRVFDSLNYVENMRLGIDAVGTAGGIVESAMSYTGDVADVNRGGYNLEYYLNLAAELESMGTHVLCIKDMAGLLTPQAARLLVGSLRENHPDLPIHVHTHDTSGCGVAAMIACAESGADAVDAAIDSMSGTTSQPSMGAIVASLKGSPLDTNIDLEKLGKLDDYWEGTREVYSQFESGQKSGSSSVYHHEIPGGQYTNMLFQSKQLGLGGQFALVKQRYEEANRLLGDIPKVTPSSKVCGDLAQFMVANDLTEADVREQASTLNFPSSVIEYFQGFLGVPPFGFPEPLRSQILEGRTIDGYDGKVAFEGRPGEEMEDFDFGAARRILEEKWGPEIRDVDVMSHCMYPAVFDEFMRNVTTYSKEITHLDTNTFVNGMQPDTPEAVVELETGKSLHLKLLNIGKPNNEGFVDVSFEMNGLKRTVRVADKSAGVSEAIVKTKADPDVLGSVGAPMPGVVVEIKVKKGDLVKEGDVVAILSAMKMETAVAAPLSGMVVNVQVTAGVNLDPQDLMLEIEP